MKVETNHKTEFKPIELKITIESKQELESLICQINCGTTTINDERPIWISKEVDGELTRDLWDKLKQIYQSC